MRSARGSRFNNPAFRADVLPQVAARSGLLVIDEAHCISDWGHDFLPDYRRLVRVLEMLPEGVPVLCTTATANDRVIEDPSAARRRARDLLTVADTTRVASILRTQGIDAHAYSGETDPDHPVCRSAHAVTTVRGTPRRTTGPPIPDAAGKGGERSWSNCEQ